MRANAMCMACLISKQDQKIRQFTDEDKKAEYMHKVVEILYRHGQTECTPLMAEELNRLSEEYWGMLQDFGPVKRQYNSLLLERESELERRIREKEDPLWECIHYVCAGNYIDFSAVENVNEETFDQLLQRAGQEKVPEQEYRAFCGDLESARKLVYLPDNCGEIVLDKIFIRLIKEVYPHLDITVILRGRDVLNDATMEDAQEVGLTELVPCVGNGNGAPGTVLKRLSPEAEELLRSADIILSKGQGNFESLYGEGLNPYYFFLCKCPLFVQRFGMERFKTVFSREERIIFI